MVRSEPTEFLPPIALFLRMGNLAAFGPSQVLANQPPGAKLPLEDAGEARVPCVSQEPSAVCRALLRVDCCSPESWLASLQGRFLQDC